MLAGCGSEILARLLGEADGTATRPIDVASWADSAEADLPITESPFGPTSVLDIEDREGIRVRMSIDNPDETLTYSLGPIFAGDRIAVQAIPNSTSRLDPVVAVFDANMNWLYYNDDRHYYDRQIDSLIDFKAREYSEECFVVVSSSPRAETVGDLDLYVSREAGSLPSRPRKQVVYLEFGGQTNVVIGRRNPVNVPVFRASAIAPELESETQALVDGIALRVREDFKPFDVTILSSQWHARPLAPHTTIYFGSTDPGLLGLSDNIDTLNQIDVQEAIIFVDSFGLFMPASPTPRQWVDVLANVASHEIGHLLGLRHTADPSEIMDTTADLVQMLQHQSFHRAPLHDGTFSVGYQDSVATLVRNLGSSGTLQQKVDVEPIETEHIETPKATLPARWFCQFGTACADAPAR